MLGSPLRIDRSSHRVLVIERWEKIGISGVLSFWILVPHYQSQYLSIGKGSASAHYAIYTGVLYRNTSIVLTWQVPHTLVSPG